MTSKSIHLMAAVGLAACLTIPAVPASAITSPGGNGVAKDRGFTLTPPWSRGETFQMTCGYGHFKHKNKDYFGLDFPMPLNEPIYAAAPGKVLLAESLGGGWEPLGKSVFIEHQNGYRTLYSHLNTINVSANQWVDRDTQIGTAGQTGSGASTVHLHFVLYDGAYVAGSVGARGPAGGSATVPEPFASCTKQGGGDCEDIAYGDYLRRDDFAPDAVVNPDGSLELFTCARNSRSLLHRRRAATGAWSGWNNLGGTCAGDPTGARDASGRLFVFVRGLDGKLYFRYRTSATSAWNGTWGSLPAPVVGRAAVALDDASNKLRVFARRHTDNALYYASQNTTTFSGWTRLGGELLNSPVAGKRADQRVDAFVAGSDYQLWKLPSNNNGTFTAENWHNQGGVKIEGEPDLVTEGALEWAVRNTSDQLRVDPGTYVSTGTHPPAAARKTNDRLHVFVRDRNNSNADYFYETGSGGWGSNTLGGLVTSELEAVRAGSGNRLIFFTWGTGGLYYRELGTATGNTNWGGWVDLSVPN